MTERFVANQWLSTEVCCKCGMLFAMPSDYQRRRRNDRKFFSCPEGHAQHYAGPSEEDRLRAELQRKAEMLDAEQARATRVASERDQIERAHKRMRARVMNGVCPCCNRTFPNLLAHMRTKHAEQRTLQMFRMAFGLSQKAVADEIGIRQTHVSLYERGRQIPDHAKFAIDSWIDRHAPRQSAEEAS